MKKFRLRPGFGSKELLIEFTAGPEKNNFIKSLEAALSSIKVVITGSGDLLTIDQMFFNANSDLGAFQISIDNWDIAFIMAKENQNVIKEIDFILSKNPDFIKELVDFKNYELKND
jgi:hypothetical protein